MMIAVRDQGGRRSCVRAKPGEAIAAKPDGDWDSKVTARRDDADRFVGSAVPGVEGRTLKRARAQRHERRTTNDQRRTTKDHPEWSEISRRQLLLSLPALAMAPRAFAQAGAPPIRARALNHMTLSVSTRSARSSSIRAVWHADPGAPGATTLLRIGSGPQFLRRQRNRCERRAADQSLLPDRRRLQRRYRIVKTLARSRRHAARRRRTGNAGGGGFERRTDDVR